MNIKNEFAENITDISKLTWQKLGKNIKAKILTAHIQAVRILYGAPDRTRTYTAVNHQILSLARLPIPPQAQKQGQSYTQMRNKQSEMHDFLCQVVYFA